MREFVSNNHSTLQLVILVLGAISVVFGGKALGRIPVLTKPGGLYSSLLVAIPAAAFFGAAVYVSDAVTNHFYSRIFSQAVQYPIETTTYAVGFGVIFVGLPILAIPGVYRLGARAQQATESTGFFSSLGTSLYFYMTGAIGVIFAAQYVFVILGWFGGHRPALLVLLALGVATPLLIIGGSALQAITTSMSGVRGCIVLVLTPILLVAFVIGLAQIVADVAFSVYIARAVGWATAVFFAIGLVGAGLLFVLRAGADRLSSKVLVGVFAFPGFVIVPLLQLALNNTNVLPQ